MPRTEQSGREDVALEPWYEYLENTFVDQARPPYILGSQYNRNPFVLKLPFKTQDIDKPAPPPSKEKDGDKKSGKK